MSQELLQAKKPGVIPEHACVKTKFVEKFLAWLGNVIKQFLLGTQSL